MFKLVSEFDFDSILLINKNLIDEYNSQFLFVNIL